MSKLFKLKEWLTVPEAAKHLSGIFEEDVTEADVLRLALDRHLKLSVLFPNGMQCRFGKLVAIDDAEYEEVPSLNGNEVVRLYGGPVLHTGGCETHVLKLSDKMAELRGIYDLPMIGGEELDVEHAYQQLIGGPEITRVAIDGAFVEGRDGLICQLCEHYDENVWQIGSKAQLAKLEAFFSSGDSGLSKEKIDEGMQKYKQDREIFQKEMASKPEIERYYPMGGLPQDVVWVVRTEILREFEQSINGNASGSPMPLATTERHTLLKQIGALSLALAEQSKKYKRGEKPNGLQIANVAGEIVDALPGANTAGLGVSSIRESIRQGIELLSAIQQ